MDLPSGHKYSDENILRGLRLISNEQLGNVAERLWENVFLLCGLAYIPLKSISVGRAPALETVRARTVLPDYDVTTPRTNCYIDSKGKRHPVYYWNAREWRHGINKNHWEAYSAIQGLKRRAACLGIFEAFMNEDNRTYSGKFLIQTLERLGEGSSGISTDSHKVYWPVEAFHVLGKITPQQLYVTYKGTATECPFRQELLDFLDRVSDEPFQTYLF